jgi:hypothetical protein
MAWRFLVSRESRTPESRRDLSIGMSSGIGFIEITSFNG